VCGVCFWEVSEWVEMCLLGELRWNVYIIVGIGEIKCENGNRGEKTFSSFFHIHSSGELLLLLIKSTDLSGSSYQTYIFSSKRGKAKCGMEVGSFIHYYLLSTIAYWTSHHSMMT